MSFKIGIGFSQHPDPETAAKEACFQSKTNIQTDRIDAAIVLFTGHYDPASFISIIPKILNTENLIGTSTLGIILSQSICSRGIVVISFYSNEIHFSSGFIKNIAKDRLRHCGGQLAQSTLSNLGYNRRNLFLFFADSRINFYSPFIHGIHDNLGSAFPIIGGGVCDNWQKEKSYQVISKEYFQNGAVGMLFGGTMQTGIASAHGWGPLGKPRIISQCEGSTIQSIDNKKASLFYQEFFGRDFNKLISQPLNPISTLYPIGITTDQDNQYLLRNAIDFLKDGSILCQGEIPQDAQAHIMIATKDSCQQATLQAAREAFEKLGGRPAKLIFVLESLSRLKLLGSAAIEEINKIKQIFGTSVPIVGLYTYGEASPGITSKTFYKTQIQSQSIVITAIG